MKKNRSLSISLAALMLVSLLAGCAGRQDAAGGDTPDSRRAANEVVVSIPQDLDNSLDPHVAVTADTKSFLFNLFEGLVKIDADSSFAPAVASGYTVSPDLTTYTFRLRDGVRFHNGQAVTMDDVVYSIGRCRDGNLVPALSAIADITCDDATLTITLNAPDSEFLSYLTLAILPADYAGQDTQPVGTGPFRFVSRTAQQELVIERFDDYWGAKAKLDRVTFRIYENADALVLALKSGAADLCSRLTSTQIAQLGDGFAVQEGLMNLVQALYLNHEYGPLANEKVRQALCYALDRQPIFDMVAGGSGAAVGSSMYPSIRKYFRDDLTGYYTYDPARAKELLAEAGYPNGFDLTITVPQGYTPHVDAGQILAEQFRAVGVNVTVKQVEWAAWLSDVYQGRSFEATVIGLESANMTARGMLERFTSPASGNFINHRNPAYDAAFERALSAASDAEQTAAYLEMEQILTETAANVYIQDIADFVAVRKGLTGYRFYPIYVMDMSTVEYES